MSKKAGSELERVFAHRPFAVPKRDKAAGIESYNEATWPADAQLEVYNPQYQSFDAASSEAQKSFLLVEFLVKMRGEPSVVWATGETDGIYKQPAMLAYYRRMRAVGQLPAPMAHRAKISIPQRSAATMVDPDEDAARTYAAVLAAEREQREQWLAARAAAQPPAKRKRVTSPAAEPVKAAARHQPQLGRTHDAQLGGTQYAPLAAAAMADRGIASAAGPRLRAKDPSLSAADVASIESSAAETARLVAMGHQHAAASTAASATVAAVAAVATVPRGKGSGGKGSGKSAPSWDASTARFERPTSEAASWGNARLGYVPAAGAALGRPAPAAGGAGARGTPGVPSGAAAAAAAAAKATPGAGLGRASAAAAAAAGAGAGARATPGVPSGAAAAAASPARDAAEDAAARAAVARARAKSDRELKLEREAARALKEASEAAALADQLEASPVDFPDTPEVAAARAALEQATHRVATAMATFKEAHAALEAKIQARKKTREELAAAQAALRHSKY